MADHTYLCIDLKSFYASVECVERGLDPLRTHLVVADPTRTEKTICLAVSPSLKAYGIPGRARLFEVIEQIRLENAKRRSQLHGKPFSGASADVDALAEHPEWQIDYLVAPPRMAHYIAYSTRIYDIYLKYVAPEDIHVYSIDEVFIDLTSYHALYQKPARAIAKQIILDILHTTGITAAAGIGTNLYLAKVAMDIVAKHIPADADGVRIAQLDEMGYRRQLWDHRPLTDFWRVGRGYRKKLEAHGLFTMGDIARCSLSTPGEDLLYRLFGVNAELLIDHAWGWESCTLADVKAYRPDSNSLGSGQVLTCPYPADKARLVVQEMADLLALELVDKRWMTDQIVLTVGYDIENLTDPVRRAQYHGPVTTDAYGRRVPKHAHGTGSLPCYTSSAKQLIQTALAVYDRVIDPHLLVRRINLTVNHVVQEDRVASQQPAEQLDLFTDYQAQTQQYRVEQDARKRERTMQQTMLDIKKKFGKNAILKGMNLQQGATARERNQKIGGHNA